MLQNSNLVAPEKAVGISRDRRNNIYQLRQAGNLDAIGMAQESNHEPAYEQRVFEVIGFFQEMWRLLAVAIYGLSAALAIPDIPLVEGQPQLFL